MRSSGSTYTAADVAAAIAKIDSFGSRLKTVMRERQSLSARPRLRRLRPDISAGLKRLKNGAPSRRDEPATGDHDSSSPSTSRATASSSEPSSRKPPSGTGSGCLQRPSSSNTTSNAMPSFDVQQRYEQLRQDWSGGNRPADGYRPMHGDGFGDDVDAAFEACSNAPY